MGNYKEEKQHRSLQSFLDKITVDEYTLELGKLPFEEALIQPLSLLAHTFNVEGEYQKSIGIYLYLIENIKSFPNKEHLFEALGKTYLKAGFLKRSESVFLKILNKHPRNIKVLYYIEVVYELLNEYEKAYEIIKPLKVLREDYQPLESHLFLTRLLKDREMSKEKMSQELQTILKDNRYSYRRVIKELFRVDKSSAWKLLDVSKVDLILDILWFLPSSNLDFDIITQSETLYSIYLAKGVIKDNTNISKSDIFVIDTINAARRGGSFELDLSFSYGCSRCKQHFPISFERCLKCYAVNSTQLKVTLAKKELQRGYSLL